MRRPPRLALRRETLATPDGDFLDLDGFGPERGPLAILLHGLSGSSRSVYILGLMDALARHGWRSVAVNYRGCSGRPNDTAWGYHSGATADLDHVYRTLRAREPTTPMAAAGFSLGGNLLVKWLGETAEACGLIGACAVSVPFLLAECATRMDQGFSRLYRDLMIRELKAYVRHKHNHLTRGGRSAEAARLAALGSLDPIRSFWQFDGQVVAGLYGFADAADYYAQSSARRFVPRIRVPTLLIQADDDPFTTATCPPNPDELPPWVRLELTRGGGHVGFVAGNLPGRPTYWLEQRIPAFFNHLLTTQTAGNG